MFGYRSAVPENGKHHGDLQNLLPNLAKISLKIPNTNQLFIVQFNFFIHSVAARQGAACCAAGAAQQGRGGQGEEQHPGLAVEARAQGEGEPGRNTSRRRAADVVDAARLEGAVRERADDEVRRPLS